jgi:hypothetical protein
MAKHTKDWYLEAATGNEIFATNSGTYDVVKEQLGKWKPTEALWYEFVNQIEPGQFGFSYRNTYNYKDEGFACVQYGLEKAGYC